MACWASLIPLPGLRVLGKYPISLLLSDPVLGVTHPLISLRPLPRWSGAVTRLPFLHHSLFWSVIAILALFTITCPEICQLRSRLCRRPIALTLLGCLSSLMSSNSGTNEPRNLNLVNKKKKTISSSAVLIPSLYILGTTRVAHGVTIAFSRMLKTCFTKARMSHLSDPKQYPAEEGESWMSVFFHTPLFHLLVQCGHCQGSPRNVSVLATRQG